MQTVQSLAVHHVMAKIVMQSQPNSHSNRGMVQHGETLLQNYIMGNTSIIRVVQVKNKQWATGAVKKKKSILPFCLRLHPTSVVGS